MNTIKSLLSGFVLVAFLSVQVLNAAPTSTMQNFVNQLMSGELTAAQVNQVTDDIVEYLLASPEKRSDELLAIIKDLNTQKKIDQITAQRLTEMGLKLDKKVSKTKWANSKSGAAVGALIGAISGVVAGGTYAHFKLNGGGNSVAVAVDTICKIIVPVLAGAAGCAAGTAIGAGVGYFKNPADTHHLTKQLAEELE